MEYGTRNYQHIIHYAILFIVNYSKAEDWKLPPDHVLPYFAVHDAPAFHSELLLAPLYL
ncbi:MAG: hypothetical protein AB7S69_15160 [Salinivirgaceae bacterium]